MYFIINPLSHLWLAEPLVTLFALDASGRAGGDAPAKPAGEAGRAVGQQLVGTAAWLTVETAAETARGAPVNEKCSEN